MIAAISADTVDPRGQRGRDDQALACSYSSSDLRSIASECVVCRASRVGEFKP